MAEAKHIIRYRRKREGRTNYKKRLALLKSGKVRLVIRRSNTQLTLQLVEYHADGDKVIVTVNSQSLRKQGWKHSLKSIPAAYLTGHLLAKAAAEKKVTEAIVDMGLQQHRAGTRIYAAVKGAFDGGLKVPVSENIFPGAARLAGTHLTSMKPDEVAAVAKKLGVTLPAAEQQKKKPKAEGPVAKEV